MVQSSACTQLILLETDLNHVLVSWEAPLDHRKYNNAITSHEQKISSKIFKLLEGKNIAAIVSPH